MNIGDNVRILEPFNISFPETYVIVNIDDNNVVFLENIEGGFDGKYLEKV